MRSAVIKIIKYCLLPFGMIYSLFHRSSGLMILMYHRVNDSVRKELSVTRKNFAWQMKFLYRNGYRVISLDDAVRLFTGGNEAADPGREKPSRGGRNEKYIVITFDDGYEDYYSSAFPVLAQYGYPSILYLVPGFIETGKVFGWDRDLEESMLLNWSQIRELVCSGLVTVGSHTMSHPDFNAIKTEEIEEELLQSKKALQDKLHLEIAHFCYPRGIVTEQSLKLVKTVYRTGVSIFNGYDLPVGGLASKTNGQGKAVENTDVLMQVKRVPAQRSDGRLLFAARLKGWLVPEEWIRRVLLRD